MGYQVQDSYYLCPIAYFFCLKNQDELSKTDD